MIETNNKSRWRAVLLFVTTVATVVVSTDANAGQKVSIGLSFDRASYRVGEVPMATITVLNEGTKSVEVVPAGRTIVKARIRQRRPGQRAWRVIKGGGLVSPHGDVSTIPDELTLAPNTSTTFTAANFFPETVPFYGLKGRAFQAVVGDVIEAIVSERNAEVPSQTGLMFQTGPVDGSGHVHVAYFLDGPADYEVTVYLRIGKRTIRSTPAVFSVSE